MVAVATMVWPLGSRLIERSDAASLPSLPAHSALGTWTATEGALTRWRPQFRNPSAELNETLRKGDAQVGLYVGYYRNQSFEQKLVSSDNVLVKSHDPVWVRVGEGSRPVDIAGQQVTVRTEELRGGPDERLVAWYWYWIDGRLTASDVRAKAYTALARLTGRGDDAAVVIVYARKERPEEAEAALAAFLRDGGAALEAMLEQTRGHR
jgi:EpsI family protein